MQTRNSGSLRDRLRSAHRRRKLFPHRSCDGRRHGLRLRDCPDSIDADFRKLLEVKKEAASKAVGKTGGRSNSGGGGKGSANTKGTANARVLAFKVCKGCRVKLRIEDCVNNFPGCWACKRVLHNITKMAARQGDDAKKFVEDARKDDDKCFNMAQSYLEKCPELGDSGAKRRGPWALAQYIERVRASTRVVRDRAGEMMWEKLFLEWASTTRGGRLGDEEAAKRWKEYEEAAARKDPSTFCDNNGPNGELRVWIHTADTMVFRSEYMHEKSLDILAGPVKKPKDDQIMKMRSDVLRDHGSVGSGIGDTTDFDGIAHGMVSHSTDVFTSNNGFAKWRIGSSLGGYCGGVRWWRGLGKRFHAHTEEAKVGPRDRQALD